MMTTTQPDGLLSAIEVQPFIIEVIQAGQKGDTELERLRQNVAQEKSPGFVIHRDGTCLLYTSPSPRDGLLSRMPSSA